MERKLDRPDRFEKEIECASRMEHQGIVKVLRILTIDADHCAIIMELAEGGDMINDIERRENECMAVFKGNWDRRGVGGTE